MSNGFEHQPIGLRAPRIPFDLRCVILAAMGYLVLLGADWLLAKVLGVPGPAGRTLAMAIGLLRGIPTPSAAALHWYQVLVTAAVIFAIWGYFGGAMMRASALRLTRDEPLSLMEALRFGGKNWATYLSAPLVVALFAGFFALCNMAAGLVMSLWGVGSSLLVIVLFPLVLLSSLLVTFAVLGGLVALPLMWAGISVEQNGALEAVSRTFSYLFARPFRFLFGYALILLVAGIVLFVSGHYEATLKRTLRAGIVRSDLDGLVSRDPQRVPVLVNEYENAEVVVRERQGISDVRNFGDARWYDKIGFFWMWLLLTLFMLGFKGYAIYVLLGGTVSLYLQLRRDVDGADESEIYPPLDEDLELADGSEPKWVGDDEPSVNAAQSPEPPQEPEAEAGDPTGEGEESSS